MNFAKNYRRSDPVLSRECSNGYNLPYKPSNWEQLIFRKLTHKGKILDLNYQWIAPSNCAKLLHTLWVLKQDIHNITTKNTEVCHLFLATILVTVANLILVDHICHVFSCRCRNKRESYSFLACFVFHFPTFFFLSFMFSPKQSSLP